MAISTMRPTLEVKITLVLDEAEAVALAELGAYDRSGMIDAIGAVTGPRVIGEIRTGLTSLLQTANQCISSQLDLAKQARRVLDGKK